MRYAEEKKGSSKDSSNRQQNDKQCIDFSGNIFRPPLIVVRHRSQEQPKRTKEESSKMRYVVLRYTMHFNGSATLYITEAAEKKPTSKRRLSVIYFALCTNVAFTRSAMTMAMAMASLITGRFPKCNFLVSDIFYLGSAARQLLDFDGAKSIMRQRTRKEKFF